MTDRVVGEVASPASPASPGLPACAEPGAAIMSAIQRLRDTEEIRLLKHRYMRCIDLKLWDQVGDVLTVNATFGTGTSAFGKPVEIRGRAEIVAFLRGRLGPAVLTEHAVSQPEITVDGDAATGVWAHRESMLATTHRMVISGTGFCEEGYERGADGCWRIAQIHYVRNYEVIMSLDDVPSFRLTAVLDGDPQAIWPPDPALLSKPLIWPAASPSLADPAKIGGTNGHSTAAGAADTQR